MKTFTFNRDPVDIFWSIPLILFTMLNLAILIFTDNSVIYEEHNFSTISNICFIIWSLITAFSFFGFFMTVGKNPDKIVLSLWMLVSFINLIAIFLLIIIWLCINGYEYTNLRVYKINDNIRNRFSKSNENTKSTNKPFWKRIISKIIGIK